MFESFRSGELLQGRYGVLGWCYRNGPIEDLHAGTWSFGQEVPGFLRFYASEVERNYPPCPVMTPRRRRAGVREIGAVCRAVQNHAVSSERQHGPVCAARGHRIEGRER